MNIKKSVLFPIILSFTACSQMADTETPRTVINQLTGTWVNKSHDGKVIFYSDETAKMVFSKHQPPIKLISTYSTIKGERIGINLGGFWSGPAFINTAKLQDQHVTITFPDEQPIILYKLRP